MKYIKVKWVHSLEDTPVMLYSAIDSNRFEVRKVEAYADGRMDFADREGRSGSTKLGIEPLPSLEEIGADPQFVPMDSSAAEFETVWQTAKAE